MKLWAYAMVALVACGLAMGAAAAPKDKADKANKKGEKPDVAGRIVKIIPDEAKPDVKTLVLAKGNAKKGGEESKYKVDAATKVRVDGKPGNVGDLKVGQRVRLAETDGTATQVIAMPAKEAGAAKDGKETPKKTRAEKRAERKAAKAK